MAADKTPKVTVVVTQRERFSGSLESLDSLLANTSEPFALVYVDAGGPKKMSTALRRRVEARGGMFLRIDSFLSPNAARNLGLARVETPYLAFVDNDVRFREGWLEELVACAEDTGAVLVSPITCQGEPLHSEIHCLAGTTCIEIDEKGRRVLRDWAGRQGEPLSSFTGGDEPFEMETVEYHTLLARTAFFEEHGPLDEKLPALHEHADLSLCVREQGGRIFLAPRSVVTYVGPKSFTLRDARFFLLRWSDAWLLQSIERMEEKWQLDRSPEFGALLRGNGWQRRQLVLRGLANRVPAGRCKEAAKSLLFRIDHWVGRAKGLTTDSHR